MFPRLLSTCTAHLPSGLKYKLKNLKPIYNRLVQLGSPVVEVNSSAGLFKWRIDEITSQEFILGAYESYMQEAFVRLIRPGFTVYDVGAQAGFHSMVCSLLVGSEGTVVAFEPNPANLSSINQQLRVNKVSNTLVMDCALGEHVEPARLDITGGSKQGFVNNAGEVAIEVKTIDSLSDTLPPPNLIKIDVEGYEEQVIRGGMATIKKHSPIIVCDPNDDQTSSLLESMLRAVGYELTSAMPITFQPAEVTPSRYD